MLKERKTVKGTTPAGEALFPKLTEPDTKFNPDGDYTVKIRLSEKDGQALLETMRELIADEVEIAKSKCKSKLELSKIKIVSDDSLPIKHELNEDAEPTGSFLFSAKQRASGISQKTGKKWMREVPLFDEKGKLITSKEGLSIWGGSIIRVAYEISSFNTAIGIGISSRLTAVQIIELRSGSSGTAESYGFDVVEDDEEETTFSDENTGGEDGDY